MMIKYTKYRRIFLIFLVIITIILSLQIGSVKIIPNITGYASSVGAVSNTSYEQWGLFGENGIQVEDAWEITEVSPNIRVGVIDTGISNHEALNVDSSLGGCFFFDDANAEDLDGHGTHIAGIIGANGTDGVYGVAPNVTLVPLRIKLDAYVWYEPNIISAINYATGLYGTDKQIDILNFSGNNFPGSNDFKDAIDNFPGLFVNSAGNHNSNLDISGNYPTSYDIDNMITVGAIQEDGTRSSHKDWGSNYGSDVDIYAPGSYIYSTGPDEWNKYYVNSGTSMAAPHVAGVAALLLSINPNLTAVQLKNIILNTADDITITIPDGSKQSVKKLNAFEAVKALKDDIFKVAGSTITGLNFNPSGELTIPDEMYGIQITTIGERAFSNCKDLISIKIPASVTSIGEQAFYGCSSLEKAIIYNQTDVVMLGSGAFAGTADDFKIYVPEDLYSDYTTARDWTEYAAAEKIDKWYLDLSNRLYSLVPVIVPADGAFTMMWIGGSNPNWSINLTEDNKGVVGEGYYTYCYIRFDALCYFYELYALDENEPYMWIWLGEEADGLWFDVYDFYGDYSTSVIVEDGMLCIPLTDYMDWAYCRFDVKSGYGNYEVVFFDVDDIELGLIIMNYL